MIDAGVDQSPGPRSMIITGRFKACDNRTVESLQPLNEAVVLGALVQHDKTPSPWRPRHLYQNIVALLENVDHVEHSILCDRMNPDHGGLLLFGGGWNSHCKRFCGAVMAPTCLRAESAASGHDRPQFRMCYGPEFIATALRDWLQYIGMKTLYIDPDRSKTNARCCAKGQGWRQECANSSSRCCLSGSVTLERRIEGQFVVVLIKQVLRPEFEFER